MKLYIKSSSEHDHPTIDIELVLNSVEYEMDLASSQKGGRFNLAYRPNLSVDKQLTHEQFTAYENFIAMVLAILKMNDFEIVDEYQSGKSYSYYVQFVPTAYPGIDPLPPIDIKFRLSDHNDTNEKDDGTDNLEELSKQTEMLAKRGQPIFKEFIINGITTNNINNAFQQIKSICQDIKLGDLSGLF